ncbi:MAG TPA: reverse transcriptase family protein [Candidatus Sumerlaeota bacterium]|nr:reverse transcriptase family protein [Candidatus Sumerlaeota bacterium]
MLDKLLPYLQIFIPLSVILLFIAQFLEKRKNETRQAAPPRRIGERSASSRRPARSFPPAPVNAGVNTTNPRCPNKRHAYIRAPRRPQSDPSAAARFGIPALMNRGDVAKWLGMSWKHLVWLCNLFHNWDRKGVGHYHAWKVPKRAGGERVITAPKPYLRAVQRKILADILSRIPIEPQAHGFARNRSTVTNASVHIQRPIVVKLDLVDFFPTITYRRVRGVFGTLGYSEEVSGVLARLCTIAPTDMLPLANDLRRSLLLRRRHLPQGAPTSPALSNLVCRRMDRRLAGLCAKFNAVYTRYADDLTFSGDEKFAAALSDFFDIACRIIALEGFRINWAKRRIMRKGARQLVTGVVVNRRTTLPRGERRHLRALLHHWRTKGDFTAPPHVENKVAWLGGKLAYFSMIDPAKGAPMLAQFKALARGR